MLKPGETIPPRRRGDAAEEEGDGREARLQEEQASGGAIEPREAPAGPEETAMPAAFSNIAAAIGCRTDQAFSTRKKCALIRDILRRMQETRLLNRQR